MKEINEHQWAQIALLFIQSLTLDSNELNPISADTRDILLQAAPPEIIDDMPDRGMSIMTEIAIHKMEQDFHE